MRIYVLRFIIEFLIEQHVKAVVHSLCSVVCVHFPLVADLHLNFIFTPMSEAELQAKLRHSKFDGAAGGRPKKLLSHVIKLASLMEAQDNLPEFEATYTQFLKDLTLYEYNMGRSSPCCFLMHRLVLNICLQNTNGCRYERTRVPSPQGAASRGSC